METSAFADILSVFFFSLNETFLLFFDYSRDYAEVQILYKQSTEHAAEQSHLIKQLEGLNLDTQKVLRNQEEAHTADTTSYQKVLTHNKPQTYYYNVDVLYSGLDYWRNELPSKIQCTVTSLLSGKPCHHICAVWQLYMELSQCYQALTSSDANLRQSHQELSNLLVQKDQHILQLQTQLQQHQEQLQQKQQQQQQIQQQKAQNTPLDPSTNRQTNFKVSLLLIPHILTHRLLYL